MKISEIYVSLRLITIAKDIMLRKSMTGRFMGQLCNIYNCYFTFFWRQPLSAWPIQNGGFSDGIWTLYEKSYRFSLLLREVFVLFLFFKQNNLKTI